MNALKVVEKSRAKINLSLDILGILENGYHEVEMIMQQIDLYDLVRVERSSVEANGNSRIEVTSNLYYLPTDQTNIAWKAANLMMETYGLEGSVKIHLKRKFQWRLDWQGEVPLRRL